jgi:CubicO group peptidase (beta-lactamase class C family)
MITRLIAEVGHALVPRQALLCGAGIVLALVCGMTAGASLAGQTAAAADPRPFNAGQVDRLLVAAVDELGGGCSLLLVRDGKTLYEKSFGRSDASKPIRIASATKWLTGAVILSLVDEGKLRLDDRAARYLPGLAGDGARITVRQLLAHTSGLAMAHPALEQREITLSQAVDAVVAAPLMYAPGQACVYGDVSVQVAGRIAEIASGIEAPSGKAWKSLFTSRLSAPLEMTATSCEGSSPTDNPHLAGGATSTARDYASFLTMLLNKGSFRGRRILSEAAVAERRCSGIRRAGVRCASTPSSSSPIFRLKALLRAQMGAGIEGAAGNTSRPPAVQPHRVRSAGAEEPQGPRLPGAKVKT